MNMKAFVTGSRAYGTKTEESDLDLAIFISIIDLQKLVAFYKEQGHQINHKYGVEKGASFRFGNLNLLCFTEKNEFLAWQEATQTLSEQKPVTRDFAVNTIKNILNQYGL